MAVIVKKRRLINPQRPKKVTRAKQAKPAKRRKTNPGTLMSIGFVNPQRSPMKQQKKRKKNPQTKAKRARAKNPVYVSKPTASKKHRSSRRRRNPNLVSTGTGMAKASLIALGSLVATRQLPQVLLGVRNKGLMGYGANLATAIAAAMVAKSVAGADAAFAAGLGGGVYIANRFLTEKLTPIGQYLSLSGLGDPQANRSRASLGVLRPGYFPTPVQYAGDEPLIPQAIVDAARPAAIPAAQVSQVAGVGRLASRF